MSYTKPNTLSATQVKDLLFSIIFCMSGLLLSWYFYDQFFFHTESKPFVPSTLLNILRLIIGSVIMLISIYFIYLGNTKYYNVN